MKRNSSKNFLTILLALVMAISIMPLPEMHVHAGHTCPDCNEWIDGEPYCSECYQCKDCVDLCIQCGVCTGCSGSEICDGCSNEDTGDTMCVDCGIDKGSHCPDCDSCYLATLSWCSQCGACEACKDMCDECSVNLGKGLLCEDCAANDEGHCPECGGCYFEIQGWCEECLRCTNCVPTCEYCSAEEGKIICDECSVSEGLHCPECNECYGDSGGVKCEECQICAACAEVCDSHELCIACGVSDGYHCPGCEACDNDATICEGCGELCSSCADAMCENCNMCSNCVTVCPECNSCSNCADICELCGEFCSECVGICDDCGLCLTCCEDRANFEGCDCSDWVCIESEHWNEHFDEYHTDSESTHNPRPESDWTWSNSYHWKKCVYCDDSEHYTSRNTHTYDTYGTCTVCGYNKNADIVIVKQPKDNKNAYVSSSYESYDDSNIAQFTVKAYGNSELTYTWCRKQYVSGVLTYVPLKYPQPGECYDGPTLKLIVPEDSCCNEYTYACLISDEEGNEIRTVDVVLKARHNYQYYKYWKTHETPYAGVSRNNQGHVLQCVGDCCREKDSGFRAHEDDNGDKICDICDYEITGIFVTKQPKDCKSAYVRSADETYDESNIAHFTVEAVGESELTYTWCRKQYVSGVLTYVPLKYPEPGENYNGSTLDIIAPEDSCYNEYTFCCFISDEEGNEIQTVDVTLNAKHNYQYFKDYLTTRENPYPGLLSRRVNGHFLQCVGTGCEKTTRLRPHEDGDNDLHCDICDYRKDICDVGITVTAPKEGETPKYTVSCDSSAYKALGEMNNGRYWFVSDNGVDGWSLIDNTGTFVAGKFYKFSVDLFATGDNVFATYNYTMPNLWAKVNGEYATAEKTYNKDASKYITVEYIFGECNDSVIENIVIDNVIEPVAGEKPTYSATVRGSGYYIDTAKNSSYDAYWANPPAKWPYIKNGIGWYDLTKGDWVYDHETFIPGHEYEIRVYLKTEEGYTFYLSRYYEMLFTASVNGYGAEGNTSGSSGLYGQTITASFQCQPKTVSTVMLYDLDAPEAGQTPDYSMTVAYPEVYQIDPDYAGSNGIVWFDIEGNQLETTDAFVEGVQYKVEIKVIPSKLESANVCKFASDTSVYLDGEQVAGDIYVNRDGSVLYLYYTFTEPALYPAQTSSVSGHITSFKDAYADVTVQLYKSGANLPSYETVVKGNAVSYKFAKVVAGTYTLRVSKEDHVTREYTVTVGADDVLQNVKIHLLGDINGDGNVNATDKKKIFAHINDQSKALTGYEFLVGDINGDGNVNATDKKKVFAHINGNPLW